MTKPFLKWAGSKRRLLDKIIPHIPPDRHLIEPFAGSCALSLGTDNPSYLIADTNPDLINLYNYVQCDCNISYCQDYFTPAANSAEVYYARRDLFNTTKDRREKAALFLYLNKHGFNGLCRYNRSGGFNVPFGRYTKPYFPAKEMAYFQKYAERCVFHHADFTETLARAKPGDVVYCDPPYVPLSGTAHFTTYYKSKFGEDEQRQLAHLAQALVKTGVTVIISNHDTAFTRDLYEGAEIVSFDVQRTISAKATQRAKAPELLAIFKGTHRSWKVR